MSAGLLLEGDLGRPAEAPIPPAGGQSATDGRPRNPPKLSTGDRRDPWMGRLELAIWAYRSWSAIGGNMTSHDLGPTPSRGTYLHVSINGPEGGEDFRVFLPSALRGK